MEGEVKHEQLLLFEFPQSLGAEALKNVVVVNFGRASHDPFIDDLSHLKCQLLEFPDHPPFTTDDEPEAA